MKSLAVLFCIIIIFSSLSNIASSKPTGYWKAYTSVDGLPNGVIRSMVMDDDGNLWIAPDGDGVCKYDGTKFSNLTKENTDGKLAGNFVYFAYKDKKGNLWFATWGAGVCRFNRKDKDFDKHLTTRDGLVSNFVLTIYQDSEENLWFGTEGGVSVYDGTRIRTFITIPKKVYVSAIFEDRAKYMWFGTTKGTIYKYKADRSKMQAFIMKDKKICSIIEYQRGNLLIGVSGGLYIYNNNQFLPFTIDGKAVFDDVEVETIFKDSKGNLWFGTTNGLRKFNDSFIEYFQSNKDELVMEWVTSIVEDGDGKLWFGTWGGGICKYDNKILHYTLSNNTPKSKITSAIEDLKNNLWFTTNGEGVFQFDNEALEDMKEPNHFTVKDGMISNEIDSVVKDGDGNLWFGGNEGITQYNGKTFKAIRLAFSLEAKAIPLLIDKKGNLWLEIQKNEYTIKIVGYNKENVQIFPLKILEKSKTKMVTLEDMSGNIWFGTQNDGIYRYNKGVMQHFENEKTKGLDGNSISSIAEDAEGNVWFGLLGNDVPKDDSKIRGGLCMYDGVSFRSFSTKNGLGSNSIASIAKDRDNSLWFGTWHGGVSKYNGSKFTNFTTTEYNLASNTIEYLLYEKKRDRLWLGSESGGISQYDGRNFQTLTVENGLLKNWVNPIIEDKNGNIWFTYEQAEQGKLTKYIPQNCLPEVQITQVVADQTYENTDEIRIPSTVNYVYFHFRDRTISQFNSTEYIYRLDGSNKEFPVTKNGQFEYENPKQGKYVFTVRSIDRDLNYSHPKSVTLTVVLPWYRKSVYIIPLTLACLAFIAAFVSVSWGYVNRRRENQRLISQQEEQKFRYKSEFLAEMSHDIRTPLQAVLGYAQILQSNDLQSDMRNGLETIEDSAMQLLELIDEILDISKIEAGIIDLQLKKFDIIEMIGRNSAISKIRCEKKKLSWRVEWEEETTKQTLASPPPYLMIKADRVKLDRILTNLVSNAINYTESGEVVLRVTLPIGNQLDELEHQTVEHTQNAMNHVDGASFFTFEVVDTGVGISQEEIPQILEKYKQGSKGRTGEGKGLGLAIAKKLIELMGGELKLESKLGQGSRFFFSVPLQIISIDDYTAQSRRQVTHLKEDYKVNAIVVDDDAKNREILSKMLSNIGVQVNTAENGMQAIEYVQSNHPDIVFMDIHMEPMDGIRTAHQIWASFGRESAKIVAVSASAFVHDRQKYLSEGFDDFIAKPFLAAEIYDCLANYLHVEYEYADIGQRAISPLELSNITLPADLLSNMKDAAEYWAITDFRNYLDDVKQLSEDGLRLAEYLYPFIQNHDMDGILDVLSKVNYEPK